MQKFKKIFAGAVMAGMIGAMSATSAFAASATVTIQPGDTMYSISQKLNVPLTQIESANPAVNPDNLQIGSQLAVPSDTYTVQPGDTFWKISQTYRVSLSLLLSANPSLQPDNLIPSDLVTIPIANTAYASQATGTAGTSDDLYWLEHVINAEANGESMQTQIAVGDVVLHRMKSPDYPKTIKDVVFQQNNGIYQFTCVQNGYIYTTPSPSAIQAAINVLQKNVDVVPGAYVFYNPAQTPAGSWVWNQPVITKLGNLIFAK